MFGSTATEAVNFLPACCRADVWIPYATIIMFVAVLLHVSAQCSTAQRSVLFGSVTDSNSGLPLVGATVILTDGNQTRTGAATDGDGQYRFENLPDDIYALTISFVGYETISFEPARLRAGETRRVDAALIPSTFLYQELVVESVSRTSEKVVDAPAGVSVLQARDVESRPALTPAEHVVGQPAVDVAEMGLNQSKISIRGFNGVVSSFDRLLVLVDYRNAGIPSLRHNLSPFLPTTNPDIQRIELVRGPGSALYGPNAANGVMHIITKSPFESAGSTISAGGGERNLFTVSGRHAQVISSRLAAKLSAQYYRGTDWKYADPYEPDSLTKVLATPQGPQPQGEKFKNDRDFDVENVKADWRVDYRPDSESSIILSGSYARMKNLNLTDVGAMQNANWSSGHVQARVVRRSLFGQVYYNQSYGTGDGNYLLRTGDILIDKSAKLAAQIQNTTELRDDGTSITYGVDASFEEPRSDGTVNGRFEADDSIRLIGGYAQANLTVSPRLSLLGAARVDHHNRLDDLVFSPRAAIVFDAAPSHIFRTTFNRSYTTPSSQQLFLDLVIAQSLGPLPYGLQGLRTPETGYQFKRNDAGGVGGLYMQSPFNPDGDRKFIPAEATSMWAQAVALATALGVDLSGIPTPSPDDVATRLGLLNVGTFAFDTIDPATVTDISRPGPGITSTFELGYKGVLSSAVFVEVDLYYSRVENLVGLLDVQTPNVFLETESLASYLENYMPGDDAAALAAGLAAIPLGTVTPVQAGALNPGDIILTYRNFPGGLDLYGLDVAANVLLGGGLRMQGTFSLVNENLFEKNERQLQDVALNAPKTKVGFRASYSGTSGFEGSVRFRFIDGFPVRSGVFQGNVDAYAVADVVAGLDLPFSRGTRVSVSVTNLTDNRHIEYVGAPEIGRLASVNLTHAF